MEGKLNREHKRAMGAAPIICDGVRGRLVDIGRGGLAFTVADKERSHFALGRTHKVTIKFVKDQKFPQKTEFEISGIVRNIHLDEHRQRLTIGLQFTDLSENDRDVLNSVILFFAQYFTELQTLEETFQMFNEQKVPLSNQDMAFVFNEVLAQLDNLPEDVYHKLSECALFLNSRMNILQ